MRSYDDYDDAMADSKREEAGRRWMAMEALRPCDCGAIDCPRCNPDCTEDGDE